MTIIERSGEDFVAEQNLATTKEGIEAAATALAEIYNRSFSGRHPELGRMVNCQFCGLRHRENERSCKQNILVPAKGPGRWMFAKRRFHPHSNRWAQARANKLAAELRKKEQHEKA